MGGKILGTAKKWARQKDGRGKKNGRGKKIGRGKNDVGRGGRVKHLGAAGRGRIVGAWARQGASGASGASFSRLYNNLFHSKQ